MLSTFPSGFPIYLSAHVTIDPKYRSHSTTHQHIKVRDYCIFLMLCTKLPTATELVSTEQVGLHIAILWFLNLLCRSDCNLSLPIT